MSDDFKDIEQMLIAACESNDPGAVDELLNRHPDALHYVLARFCDMNEYDAVFSLIHRRPVSSGFIQQAIDAGVDTSLVVLLANHACRQRDAVKKLMEDVDDEE